MAQVFEDLAGLNRLIHEPARLSILTALGSCTAADFVFLQRLTGLTQGNLSTHLSKLADAGLITIEKEFIGKIPHTMVQITAAGQSAITQHWQKLEELRQAAKAWQSTGETTAKAKQ